MKISIQEIPSSEEEEVVIKCHEINDDILALLNKLKTSDKQVIGIYQDEMHRISIKDVYYFETVDNKSFLYCQEKVYSSKLKLYEFEEITANSGFLRISKSTVVNAIKISHVKPSFSGRFEASMENGEKIVVSRQYVPELKKYLGL